MPDKPPEDDKQDASETENQFIDTLAKLIEPRARNLSAEYIREILGIVIAADAALSREISQADGFLSFADIEEAFGAEARRVNDASLKHLSDRMKRMVGEDSIVLDKKRELKKSGIKVKRWRYYKNSILTLAGRVSYERVALKASARKDKIALEALGYKGHVYPVDELLGVTYLPFDMTIAATLKAAEEACVAASYEKAQKRLARSGINVNDDTIRAVVNTIGGLVLDNEIQAANEAVLQFEKGLWRFPRNKKPGVLYFQIEGSMALIRNAKGAKENNTPNAAKECQIARDFTIPSPERPVKNASWMEYKQGVAYSDDNILWMTDERGVKQRAILQKDYVSFIGEASEFSKFMRLLAIRNGYGHYQETVIISDGATWISELKDKYFPDARIILDFCRLRENVLNFSKNVFAMDENKYKPWSAEICSLLKKSQTKEALKKIKDLGPKRLSKSSTDLARYIENNINRVDYAACREKGYFIASGALEGSDASLAQSRTKLSGARWDLEAARKMGCLLAKLNSGRWEEDVVKAVYQRYNLKPGRQFNLS
ncbi:MAG: hypothetical protein LBO66_01185 [Deltaproteobacteria bacterium]|jgi:hypothetical protein|nr:hypothetical protein [Deltaproteobacteria bacterium]